MPLIELINAINSWSPDKTIKKIIGIYLMEIAVATAT